jgi:hypothetical protein
VTGGGFTVVPSEVQTNGAEFAAVADQVRAVQTTLLAKLNAEGACWGNDEAGAQIAKTYLEPAMKALQQMDDVDGGVSSMAEATASWAKSYQSVENA